MSAITAVNLLDKLETYDPRHEGRRHPHIALLPIRSLRVISGHSRQNLGYETAGRGPRWCQTFQRNRARWFQQEYPSQFVGKVHSLVDRKAKIAPRHYSNVIYMNGGEQPRSILVHLTRHIQAASCAQSAYTVEEMPMRKLKLIFVAAALCGGLTATAASAMPIAPIQTDTAAQVEQVRWVCGPYRCWWRPNYYGGYGAYSYYPRHRYHRYWRHRHYW
jgi:hypothetical protein